MAINSSARHAAALLMALNRWSPTRKVAPRHPHLPDCASSRSNPELGGTSGLLRDGDFSSTEIGKQTRLLRLRYRNQARIVEPHDYGEHNGVVKLLAWQIAGSSSGPIPNWRWMETDLISEAELLDLTLPGGRPAPSGKHHKWNKLFLRVKPANKKPD